MRKNKVLLIGWDAADWKIIGPLLAKGQMPALKRLIDTGVYGNMSTMNPPYSPMLWSTVATGKTPDKHGIHGFIEVTPDNKSVRPVTVKSRKARALWNIFHYKGLKSNVVGWWPSFPAEPINGVVVSDRFQKVKMDPNEKNPIVKGTIYPENLTEELHDLRLFPFEITEAHILPFIPRAAEINQDEDKGLQSFAKIMAENTSVHAAATNLIRTTDWDFMAVYYDLIDHFCHAFMKYHPPKLNGIHQGKFDIYKGAVVGAYRFQDMMLDRMIGLVDDDTTIIVMSDHGYESGHRRILKMPKYPAAPALEHRKFGIFVAAGPNIKKNEKIFGLGLIDVAPTILHMYGLPVGKDMDGKVALDIFEKPSKINYLDSWENLKGDFGQHQFDENVNLLDDNETMQQLVDLGYIEKPDENKQTAVLKTSCELKHNLARVYLGKKDYNSAKKILLELIHTDYPKYDKASFQGERGEALERQGFQIGDTVVDVVPFYMDLLSISLEKNEYDEAEIYLNKLRKLDKRFEINTSISEAKILIAKGKVNKALDCLDEAIKKNPTSQVWYQIGLIYRRLNKFEEAKEAFENALDLEADSAKSHQALAETLIRLKNYELAAEHALTSIELVKYFPDAHYTLGEALEKMGDLKNAKIAYETAKKLKPKKHFKVEMALENVKEKENLLDIKDKAEFKFRENQIVIVSGLPRSGTSLMMQMLNVGGLKALSDKNRKADISNPNGYFEYKPVMNLYTDNTWLFKAQNKCLKVVAPLLKYLDTKHRYKIIFMNRDLTEVIKSQQKMLGKDPEILPIGLFDKYKSQLSQIETWKDKEPGVELIYIDYKDLLDMPAEIVNKIETFIGVKMNKEKMMGCVDKSLYRTKSK